MRLIKSSCITNSSSGSFSAAPQTFGRSLSGVFIFNSNCSTRSKVSCLSMICQLLPSLQANLISVLTSDQHWCWKMKLLRVNQIVHKITVVMMLAHPCFLGHSHIVARLSQFSPTLWFRNSEASSHRILATAHSKNNEK